MNISINRSGFEQLGNIFTKETQANPLAAAQTTNKADSETPSKLVIDSDTVDISDYAKKLAINNRENEDNLEHEQVNPESSSSPSVDQIQKIREQIQEIQEKIQDAQKRLMEAQASSNADAVNPDESDEEKAQKTMSSLLTQSSEVQEIQAEIEMLNQQLLTLNDQLKEAMQGRS